MLTWGTTKFLASLAFPWAVRKAFAWLTTPKSPTPTSKSKSPHSPQPLTPTHKLALFTLCLWASFCLFAALYSDLHWRPNFFQQFSLPSITSCQGFQIRGKFRAFTDQLNLLFPTTFPQLVQKRKELECTLEEYTVYPPSRLEVQFVRLARLTEMLSQPALRRIYAKYGEEALLNCAFCKEEGDYCLYVLVQSALFYLGNLMAFRAWTLAVPGKSGWWRLFCILVGLLAVHEVWLFAISPSGALEVGLFDLLWAPWAANSLLLQKVAVLRDAIIGIALVIACAFDKREAGDECCGSETPMSQGKAASKSLERALKNGNLLRLYKVAVGGDGDLRRFTVEQSIRRELMRDSVMQDEQLAEYKRQVMGNSSAMLEAYAKEVVGQLKAVQDREEQ